MSVTGLYRLMAESLGLTTARPGGSFYARVSQLQAASVAERQGATHWHYITDRGSRILEFLEGLGAVWQTIHTFELSAELADPHDSSGTIEDVSHTGTFVTISGQQQTLDGLPVSEAFRRTVDVAGVRDINHGQNGSMVLIVFRDVSWTFSPAPEATSTTADRH